jgi:hypothetical protein
MPKGDEMKLLRTEAVIGWILDDIITNSIRSLRQEKDNRRCIHRLLDFLS